MNHWLILSLVAAYFIVLLLISYATSKGAKNEHFFIGEKNSKWYLVAYGMIGTSLSGVTFMSVPGKVSKIHFFYFQIIIGYLIGYFIVAAVLLPLYYRLQLTSIYSFLKTRFGNITYKTGASFFLLSRTLGASLRIYLVLYVLQTFVLDSIGVPFAITAFVILLMIVLYTYKGGVKTIIWTDTLQTTFMILALIVTLWVIKDQLGLSMSGLFTEIQNKGYTQIFDTDWKSPTFFLKQIISGMFITITMTGLDQEMMQKNISIKTLGKAQQNMFAFSVVLLFVSLLFLFLGAALYVYASTKGITLSPQTDDTFPLIALQFLPPIAGILFIIGLISALFPSADGAMTALTSSFCIDILNMNDRADWDENTKTKRRISVHLSVAVIFFLIMLVCKAINEKAIIDLVLDIAGYTYGPLLGLFAFGIFLKNKVHEKLVPVVCISAPIITYILKANSKDWFGGYQIGFETLLINGVLTFIGLALILTRKGNRNEIQSEL